MASETNKQTNIYVYVCIYLFIVYVRGPWGKKTSKYIFLKQNLNEWMNELINSFINLFILKINK